MGGIENVYIIHHIFGIIFIILFIIHILISILGITLYKWIPSMLISYEDFRNLVDDLKYFLGIKNMPANVVDTITNKNFSIGQFLYAHS